MGVLPLVFPEGENVESLGLTGAETYTVEGLDAGVRDVAVAVTSEDGGTKRFSCTVRVDTPKEWDYYLNGGILQYVIRQLVS